MSMYRFRSIILALVAIVAVACGGKKDEEATEDEAAEGEGETTAGESAEAPEEPATDETEEEPASTVGAQVADTPFRDYDLAAVAGDWGGIWVVGGSSVGTEVAWKVEGGKVVQWDGQEETELDFHVLAPCYARTKDEAAGVSTYHTFAFDSDTLYSGLGGGGVVTEAGAVVCAGGKIYELADGTCTVWKQRFGDWEEKEGTCSLEDGIFEADGRELKVQGKAILDQQMGGNEADSFEDFEAAKAALED